MSDESERVTDRYDNEVPPELDGVDLKSAFDCPNCGVGERFIERPAGYYTCPGCWSTWAGDPENANIVDYVSAENSRNGRPVDSDGER